MIACKEPTPLLAADYLRFIVEELKVDRQHRTLAGRDMTYISVRAWAA